MLRLKYNYTFKDRFSKLLKKEKKKEEKIECSLRVKLYRIVGSFIAASRPFLVYVDHLLKRARNLRYVSRFLRYVSNNSMKFRIRFTKTCDIFQDFSSVRI